MVFLVPEKHIKRRQAPVDTSDNSFIGLLHDEPLSIMKPEDVCQELKTYF